MSYLQYVIIINQIQNKMSSFVNNQQISIAKPIQQSSHIFLSGSSEKLKEDQNQQTILALNKMIRQKYFLNSQKINQIMKNVQEDTIYGQKQKMFDQFFKNYQDLNKQNSKKIQQAQDYSNSLPKVQFLNAIQKTILLKENTQPEINVQQILTQKKFINKLFQIIQTLPHFKNLLSKHFHKLYQKFFLNQYLTNEQQKRLIKLLLDYMQFSLFCLSSSIKNQTSYTLDNFIKQFGKEAKEILNLSIVRNNMVFNNLKYLQQFTKKKFNLNEYKQIYQTAHEVKSLCANDSTALAYLSAYFVKCCENIEKQNVSIQQINSILKQQARKIKQVFSVIEKSRQESQFLPKLSEENDETDSIQPFKRNYKMKQFQFQTNSKQQEIDNFIMEMVDLGKKYMRTFKQLTFPICNKNQGYAYKCNLKISQKTQVMPLLRVKQKLLEDYVKEYYKDKKYPNVKTIQELKKAEIDYLNQVLRKIYTGLEKIVFSVTDLLRGKCMFNEIKSIAKSVEDIRNNVQQRRNKGQPIQIVAIKNRLKGITKDVMILIKIQDIVCEFQLVFKFNQAQNDIHHKMYEIERSIAFTPIYVLHEWHMRSSKNFLQLSNKIIKEKEQSNIFDSKQKKNLDNFYNFFQYDNKPNSEMCSSPISTQNLILFDQIMEQVKNVPSKNQQIKKLQDFRGFQILKSWRNLQWALLYHCSYQLQIETTSITIKNRAELHQALGMYRESASDYEDYLKQLNKNQLTVEQYSTVIIQLCNAYMKLCKNEQALDKIKELISLQQKQANKFITNSYLFLGDFYLSIGQNKAALDSYKEAEKQSVNYNLKETQIYVETISKIGYVTALLGDYKLASDILTKALNIAAQMFGTYSVPIAKVYSLIGKAYSEIGRYGQAIQNLQKSAFMMKTILQPISIEHVEALLDLCQVLIQARMEEGVGLSLQQASEYIQQLCTKGSMLEIRCDILKNRYNRQAQRKLEESIKIILKAAEKVKAFNLPDQNPIILQLAWQMGEAFSYKYSFQKADFFFNGAYTVLVKIYGEDCLKATQLRLRMANLEGWRKDYKAGIELLNQNIKYFQQRKLINNIHYAKNLCQLAYQQCKINLFDQSNKNHKQAQRVIKLVAGAGSGSVAEIYWCWGVCLGEQKQYKQALNKIKTCISIYQKVKRPSFQMEKYVYFLLQNQNYEQFNKFWQQKDQKQNQNVESENEEGQKGVNQNEENSKSDVRLDIAKSKNDNDNNDRDILKPKV